MKSEFGRWEEGRFEGSKQGKEEEIKDIIGKKGKNRKEGSGKG